MIEMNPDTIIGECLETAFHLKVYSQMIERVHSPNFRADSEFRTMFNGFYVIRQKKAEWYDKYYLLLEQQKENPQSFETLLRLMSEFGSLEVSFVSKLIAAVDPSQPIWDQYVIRNLGFETTWERARSQSKESRIDLAVQIYTAIGDWYQAFLESDQGKACVRKFDDALPKYRDVITDVKKIDYLIWSKR